MENTKFKVYIEKKAQSYAKFSFEPLERGYGDTLGNALRRVLLSSIRGTAVTAVKIDGVLHEFSTVKGVREDVIEILMNLKHIPIRTENLMPDGDYVRVSIEMADLPEDFFKREENKGVLTAADMPSNSEVQFQGDGVICTLEPNAKLSMVLYLEQGIGYKVAERDRPHYLPVDAIMTDAVFSPVTRVNYKVEPARVGQSIDFERLILEVWTNGAISPEEAVIEASSTAEKYFAHVATTVQDFEQQPQEELEGIKAIENNDGGDMTDEDFDEDADLAKSPIHELNLTIRSENCLLRGGITTIGDLLSKTREDLLKIRNLGKISLVEVLEKLEERGLELKKSDVPLDLDAIEDVEAEDIDDEADDVSENRDTEAEADDVEPEAEKPAKTAKKTTKKPAAKKAPAKTKAAKAEKKPAEEDATEDKPKKAVKKAPAKTKAAKVEKEPAQEDVKAEEPKKAVKKAPAKTKKAKAKNDE